MPLKLSYCSDSIPGKSLTEKMANARRAYVAVDLSVYSKGLKELARQTTWLKNFDIPTVIAEDCHGRNILSNPEDRNFFNKYTAKVGDLAKAIGADSMLTTIYEKHSASIPQAREIYYELEDRLSPDIDLFIEVLEPDRTVFCPSVEQMLEFVKELNRTKILVDTDHLQRSETDLYQTLEKTFISGIHYRDSNMLPPGKGSIDFRRVTGILKSNDFPGHVTVECKQFPNYDSFRRNVIHVKEILSSSSNRRS